MFVLGGKVSRGDAAVVGERLAHERRPGRHDRARGTECRARRQLAVRAAEAVGCPIAGVDLLPGPRGELYVIEVNAVPGWKALAPTCGVDVAAEIVRFVAGGRGEMGDRLTVRDRDRWSEIGVHLGGDGPEGRQRPSATPISRIRPISTSSCRLARSADWRCSAVRQIARRAGGLDPYRRGSRATRRSSRTEHEPRDHSCSWPRWLRSAIATGCPRSRRRESRLVL